MSSRSVTIAAATAAVMVFLIGGVFAVARDRDYESSTTVVLSPNSEEPERISELLESFERSGTLGTYVELMAADDTTAGARALGAEVTVRAIPDTRAIRVTAVGGEAEVQPALESVIETTRTRKEALRDLFVIEVLEAPSAPVESGPGAGLLLLATVLLSAFAALAVIVILRRVAPPVIQSSRQSWDKAGPARAKQ